MARNNDSKDNSKNEAKIAAKKEAELDNDSYGAIVLGVAGWILAFIGGSISANSIMLIITVIIVFGCLVLSIFHGIKGLTSHITKTKIRSLLGILISVLYIIFFVNAVVQSISALERAKEKTERMYSSDSESSYVNEGITNLGLN
jgi:uncharacterized membrane protein YdfJ with MMPL/SSD domain